MDMDKIVVGERNNTGAAGSVAEPLREKSRMPERVRRYFHRDAPRELARDERSNYCEIALVLGALTPGGLAMLKAAQTLGSPYRLRETVKLTVTDLLVNDAHCHWVLESTINSAERAKRFGYAGLPREHWTGEMGPEIDGTRYPIPTDEFVESLVRQWGDLWTRPVTRTWVTSTASVLELSRTAPQEDTTWWNREAGTFWEKLATGFFRCKSLN